MPHIALAVLKSPDTATVKIDEIDAHLSGRLLSCSEALWRILGLPLHKEWPPVMRLHIHLPNEQSVIFCPDDDSNDIQDACDNSTSTLLQWFELNKSDPAARCIRYTRIPEHYTWLATDRVWQRRKEGRETMSIGRTLSVSHRNQELFALRRLLDVVVGATDWADLLTVDGTIYSTFQAACGARGMLHEDADAIAAFQSVTATNCSLDAMRREFALLLLHRSCQNAVALFDMFADDLCENGNVTPHSYASALYAVEDIFIENSRSLKDLGFTLPPRPSSHGPPACFKAHMYDEQQCIDERDQFVSQFTAEQHGAMAILLAAVSDASANTPKIFSILSSAGTGKSLFVNGVTWHLRAQQQQCIVLNVAASALAATVLSGGRTAHSCFRIPIPANSSSFCGMKSDERRLIRASAIIFYDEISMVSSDVADTLDRSLREVMGQPDVPFGGKPICFCGDFKQLLPVVPGSSGDHTVKNCDWWRFCRVIRFNINWRAAANPQFAALLDDVGNGSLEQVQVPEASRVSSVEQLVRSVYGDNMLLVSRQRRLILALTLDTCRAVNDYCLDQIAVEALNVAASDDMSENRDLDSYPLDYIASLQLHGAPPAVLQLKCGARYMIVKNYDHQRGVVNGTLCELMTCSRHLLQVRLLTGTQEGRIIVLPRCSFAISPENSGLPFAFTRVQFPIIPAYCVTVHKAQGQTLEAAGLFFEQDCFAHGQLYTALSRTGGWHALHVLLPPHETVLMNLVRKHILT